MDSRFKMRQARGNGGLVVPACDDLHFSFIPHHRHDGSEVDEQIEWVYGDGGLIHTGRAHFENHSDACVSYKHQITRSSSPSRRDLHKSDHIR